MTHRQITCTKTADDDMPNILGDDLPCFVRPRSTFDKLGFLFLMLTH